MKVSDSLTAYRIIMVFIHLYCTSWIIELWGLRLKTFLFLTKINFFANFFYFFYTSFWGKRNLEILERSLTKSEKAQEKHRREIFENTLYKFSFCLSVAVNILYWSLNFLVPSMLGNTPTPVVLDLFLHGGNLLVLFFDYLLDHNCDKGNHRVGTSFLLKFSILYVFLQYLAFYTLSIEVYPLISKLTIPQFSMVAVSGFGLFMVGHVVYERVLVLK
jgi:hypothetical protein